MRNSKEIKQEFLKFFESKGHKIVPSAPIVVKGDPTLMFTNAGMNQFKDYFLGNAKAVNTRIADTQKCLRVSGKHNDLEEVGHDHYHHTMFEMLGNWSFGDYFKKDAIHWAWELLTEIYKLDKDRLYVSVFEGDEKEGLQFDKESFDIWRNLLPEDRILRGNKKDNFWEMGDTGPCGPCTEIHYDGREKDERIAISGANFVNADHPDVIEIWNNVFMEFNRKADGSLEKLPAQHVDTGMGFERLVRVIQNKKSNYDTDVFQYIIENTSAICHKKYGENEKQDIAFRVIADHIRAVALCIADGQLPANTGAGYVVRRILRRAVRYGFSYLGIHEPFLCKLVQEVGNYFSDVFPELQKQSDFVSRVIREEEASFFRTLSNGLLILNQFFDANSGRDLDAKTAFELYDTYGFPIDLTELICKERGVAVDKAGFDRELQTQKARSRADAQKETGDWTVLLENAEEGFVGYDVTEAHVKISRYRTVMIKGKPQFQLVFNVTPFYAESGGQVGDTGKITGEDGEEIYVLDCVKENKLHIHLVEALPKNVNQLFVAKVNAVLRGLTEANHSATHLLHSALRTVLGNHVAQKGSLVNAEHLRFDFSHFAKLEEAELQQVEDMVNEKIMQAIPLEENRSLAFDDAIAMGATALFGEKYGDVVRVIIFDKNYSMELCGGTHVNNTSKIGLFKLTSEGSVAAGVRRIEAVTSKRALDLLHQLQRERNSLVELLNHAKDPVASVKKLITENEQLLKRLEQLEQEKVNSLKDDLLADIVTQNGMNRIVANVVLPSAEAAKNLCFQLKQSVTNLFCVIAFEADAKPGIAVMISDELVAQNGLDAGAIVRELGKEIQGGGGGQKFFATAGGKDLGGLPRVVEKAKGLFLSETN
ncbi:MAG: alanine--tRNA ligase [Bacteroidetes bacterium]|nr:alanine--tRNA ligase [Bacteroidota bacterium]